jgi:hypothetical protein
MDLLIINALHTQAGDASPTESSVTLLGPFTADGKLIFSVDLKVRDLKPPTLTAYEP